MESTPNHSDLSRGLLACVLAGCFLAACAIAYQVVQGYLTGPKVAAGASPGAAPEAGPPRWTTRPPRGRLLVMIIDGLPEHVALTPGRLPWLDSLRTTGAWGVSMAPPVTMTTSCVRTIGTGYEPPLMDVLRTFDAPAVKEDHLFRRLERERAEIVFAGDASWTQLFGQFASKKLALPDRGIYDTTESDEQAEAFVLDLSKQGWFWRIPGAIKNRALRSEPMTWIAVLHFVGSDHVAHRTGAQGEEYFAKLREIDDRFRRIHASLVPDMVLVMADHGATAAGNHGGGEEVARRAPFVLAGQGVRAGGPHVVDHKDWAATLAFLMNVAVPDRAERGPAWPMLADRRPEYDEDVLRNRRNALLSMGVPRESVDRAATGPELDALRDRASGAQPVDVAYGGLASVALLVLLVAVGFAPKGAGTGGGAWMLFGVTLLGIAAVFMTGEWRSGLVVGLLGAGCLAFHVKDERRSWPMRVGPPWVLGVLACAVASWAVGDGLRAARAGEFGGVVAPALAVLAMGVPVARSPGRIGRLMKEGGLGLSLFAVAAAIPAVWCYWLSHRGIYAAIAVIALGALAWARGPRALRPFLALAATLAWALTAPDAERVPRVANNVQTAALGAVLCLPLLVGLRRSAWPLVLSAGFLELGLVHRFAGIDVLADVMLLGGLPIAIGACLLARDPATRRRALLLWGLGLFRVLAKDHQFVTLALYAWLIDELAERLVARPAHLAVLVGAMVALDLLQFHLLGSVYTFSTIDVTSGFVGTSKGLDLPRTAALIFLRYAVPLLFVALLPPPSIRSRALALFAACLLSRCVYLLVLFPWKRSDFWWVCSAAPGVIFTAFQIGLWLLVALAAASTVPRSQAEPAPAAA